MTLDELKSKLIGKLIQSVALGNVEIIDVSYPSSKNVLIQVKKSDKTIDLYIPNEQLDKFIERINSENI